MEEYTDICSLLGLEDIDMKPPALNDKQTIIEETLCDPSDLLDFLVSEQFIPSYSSLLSNLNIDINLNINDLSHHDRSGLAEPPRHEEDDRSGSGVSDLIDSESDSGVESINSLSPQDPSPPGSPSDLNLSLSSIHAMLPLTPLPIRELTETASLDAGEMLAVPPRLLIKRDKKPSLLSSILARPPIETAASRQLSSLLNSSPAPGNTEQNFSGFDSFKQKDNGRSDSTVRTVPTAQTEREHVREIPARKKLIINKRKKEMLHIKESKKLHQDDTNKRNLCLPWDGDLRSPMTSCDGSVSQVTSDVSILPNLQTEAVPQAASQSARPPTKFEKTFICPTCDASFSTASARSCHRRQVHQRHHLCVTCDRAFTNQQKLERHLKIHRTESKKLKYEKMRKMPEESLYPSYTNIGKKRFECMNCPREYFTKSGLNHHLKQVHSNERLYKCSQCEFVGKTSFELENHCESDHAQSISSTPDRNPGFANSLEDIKQKQLAFDCPAEDNAMVSFTQSKTNTMNKTNQCNHCGRKFAFKNSLTKHLSKGRCVILKKSQHQQITF